MARTTPVAGRLTLCVLDGGGPMARTTPVAGRLTLCVHVAAGVA